MKSSNLSADNSVGRYLSPRYGQVILVSRYTILTAVNQNMDVQYQVAGSKLAIKCEIKHWCACAADGQKVGWSVSGHVIAKFSRIDRFSKLWGFELSS